MQLQALTVLAHCDHARSLTPMVLEGRIADAVSHAGALLSCPPAHLSSDDLCAIAQVCADLMLSLDRAEEAEETYRIAVKFAGTTGSQRGAVRVASCRSTGFLSLYQHRFGAAVSCFGRIAADDASSLGHKVEAFCALAMARHGLGQKDRAIQALDDACEAISVPALHPELSMLVSLVRVDLLAQDEIRTHGDLSDHVFWHAPAQSLVAQHSRSTTPVQPLDAIQGCLSAHGRHPFVSDHLVHLRNLVLASCGDARAMAALPEHIARLRRAGLVAMERQARIETALVAITSRQGELARSVLDPLMARDAEPGGQRWNVELAYCMAKVCALGGRFDESMRHYQRYALESMQCVRTESSGEAPAPRPGVASPTSTRDDIEMRLPAKYRRAYRYLIEHLDCAELSVREIADDIGVTERALQGTFKTHLGMTPVEVMQRCRVERIRTDLLRTDVASSSVTETAARWGIRNRSTLVTSYRKYCSETPTETLARRGSSSLSASR
jgi:AraC-like DNA-binding protein